jgi:hypothetical protein
MCGSLKRIRYNTVYLGRGRVNDRKCIQCTEASIEGLIGATFNDTSLAT